MHVCCFLSLKGQLLSTLTWGTSRQQQQMITMYFQQGLRMEVAQILGTRVYSELTKLCREAYIHYGPTAQVNSY